MRKIVLTPFLLVLVVLSGCGSEKHWDATTYETINDLERVTMGIKEGTVSSTGLTVIFENESDIPYIFGDFYLLEKKIDGKWYHVPIKVASDNYGFDDIGYKLAPSMTKEWEVDWEWLYGKLDAGEYRIVKDLLDNNTPGEFESYDLAAEFIIHK